MFAFSRYQTLHVGWREGADAQNGYGQMKFSLNSVGLRPIRALPFPCFLHVRAKLTHQYPQTCVCLGVSHIASIGDCTVLLHGVH